MRAALLLLVACGKTPLPPKPDLTGMGLEQRCLATAPRGKACADEIMAASINVLGDPEFAGAMRDELKSEGDSSKSEALKLHHVTCLGDDSYPARLVTCWDQPDCDSLALCVYPVKK